MHHVDCTDGRGPAPHPFAQVMRSVSGTPNYRTIVNGYAFADLSSRDVATECSAADAHNLAGVTSELQAILAWIERGTSPIPPTDNGFQCGVDAPDGEPANLGPATRLESVRPNPFNPRTTLRFVLGSSGRAELSIFDIGGRKVRTLVDAVLPAGPQSAVWDGTDDAGSRLPAGVYWSQLRAGGYESQRKMILIK